MAFSLLFTGRFEFPFVRHNGRAALSLSGRYKISIAASVGAERYLRGSIFLGAGALWF